MMRLRNDVRDKVKLAAGYCQLMSRALAQSRPQSFSQKSTTAAGQMKNIKTFFFSSSTLKYQRGKKKWESTRRRYLHKFGRIPPESLCGTNHLYRRGFSSGCRIDEFHVCVWFRAWLLARRKVRMKHVPSGEVCQVWKGRAAMIPTVWSSPYTRTPSRASTMTATRTNVTRRFSFYPHAVGKVTPEAILIINLFCRIVHPHICRTKIILFPSFLSFFFLIPSVSLYVEIGMLYGCCDFVPLDFEVDLFE